MFLTVNYESTGKVRGIVPYFKECKSAHFYMLTWTNVLRTGQEVSIYDLKKNRRRPIPAL